MHAGEIAAALTASMEKGYVCFHEVKNGPSWAGRGFVRMDFFAIKKTWTPVEFKGYEIKVSRQDFLQDKEFDFWLCGSA